NADIVVSGTIEDALVVIHGTATIREGGAVRNNVTVVNGDLVLDGGSEVNDVRLVRSDLTEQPGALIRGDVDRTSGFFWAGLGAALLFGFLFWLGFTIAVLIAGVLL